MDPIFFEKLRIYFLVEKIIFFINFISCGHFQLSCSYIIAHRDVQLRFK